MLCYRPEWSPIPFPEVMPLTVTCVTEELRNWRKQVDGYVDKILFEGHVFERSHARIFNVWTVRGLGRCQDVEGIGADLRAAYIDLLHKIVVFEMRELLGCDDAPRSLTDWNLRHGQARGVRFHEE